jgi:hypothetical protein
MNSGIPLENFPFVPQGHHHHHQNHLAFTCFNSIHVGVRYARRRTNNKCSIPTGCNYEPIDLTKKNVKNKNFRELYVLHFLLLVRYTYLARIMK